MEPRVSKPVENKADLSPRPARLKTPASPPGREGRLGSRNKKRCPRRYIYNFLPFPSVLTSNPPRLVFMRASSSSYELLRIRRLNCLR